MRIDLHTHSTCSDGTDTPAELIAAAVEAGLDVVALTDHDTTIGWDEAEAAARQHGIRLVRGLELSTDNSGQSQHLLAYEVDPLEPELVAMLERGVASRQQRIPRMIKRLADLKFPVDEAHVRAAAGEGPVGRPHVADAMIRARHVKTREEAFVRFLGDDGPAYVPREKLAIEEAIATVRKAGGVPVIAHPLGRGAQFTRERFAELQQLGLVGVEVDHEEHDPEMRTELRGIAEALGLVATGSSDYHGTGKKGHRLGCNTTTEEALDALLAACGR